MRDIALQPVVAVMGARQVGKSTLCRQVAEKQGLTMLTLDDQWVRRQAVEDPAGLLEDLGPGGAFIDEAQRAPDLILAVKAVVDRDQRPGRFLLSGSNQPRMSGSVSDSLLGRVAYRTLRPLTLNELRFTEEQPGWTFLFEQDDSGVLAELERRAADNGALDWRDIVRTGGFPRAVKAPPEARLGLLNDYASIFATRDVREVIAVDSAERFESFFRLMAARTGQELNANGMATDLGVPVATIRRWIDALRRAFLIELIQPYSRNASQRVIKSPKVFLVDAALAMAAARETEPTGFHLETLVASDLLAWRDLDPLRAVYHWRLASQQEVDFVIEERGQLVPIEVKATRGIELRDAKHLRTFRERHGNAPRGLLLSADPGIRILTGGIIAAPWWAAV